MNMTILNGKYIKQRKTAKITIHKQLFLNMSQNDIACGALDAIINPEWITGTYSYVPPYNTEKFPLLSSLYTS